MKKTDTNEATDADVIVIGAGVAGLEAAGELGRRGYSVILLEARGRVGGRVFSASSKSSSSTKSKRARWPESPIELGAEFMHGGSPTMKALLKRARVGKHPVNAPMWWRQGAEGLKKFPDFWERVSDVVAKIPKKNRGWSFTDFLRERGHLISAEDRWLTEYYAGGFNAAPVTKLSAQALKADHAGADNTDYKLTKRYDLVVAQLVKQLPKNRVWLRTNAVVAAVKWSKGAVSVSLRTENAKGRGRKGSADNKSLHPAMVYRARAAIVTLPLGILKAKQVRFSPSLGRKQTLISSLGWGQVVRIVFRVKPAFWKWLPIDKTQNPTSARAAKTEGHFTGFLNGPGEAFPVWWALAKDQPLITGWVSGDAATPILPLNKTLRVKAAISSLAALLRVTKKDLKNEIVGCDTHDWHGDSYSLGAYSYATAGYEDGPAKLGKSIKGTLFFAGEATADEIGTVHGALASGLRAAKEAEAAL